MTNEPRDKIESDIFEMFDKYVCTLPEGAARDATVLGVKMRAAQMPIEKLEVWHSLLKIRKIMAACE